jgi:hypothetical protein
MVDAPGGRRGRGAGRRSLSDAPSRAESIADQTRRYLDGRPFVRDCLGYDIVNYTALARWIRRETHLPSQEAIEIACRRYRRQMSEDPGREEQLRAVVRASHIEIRTRIAVVTARGDFGSLTQLVLGSERIQEARERMLALFNGWGTTTVLCEETMLPAVLTSIPRHLVIGVQRRLSALTIRSPEEVLVTPRVLGFLTEAIGRWGINCIEMISVFTDTILVLRSEDAIRAFEILSELMPDVEEPEGLPRPMRSEAAATSPDRRPDLPTPRGARRPRRPRRGLAPTS